MSLEAGAVDVSDRAPHGAARDHAANAGDRESRKQQDFEDLVDHALQKAGSKKALVPSKSKKNMQEVDLSKLTRSKRQLVIEQALESKDADPEKFFGKLKDRMQRAQIDLASVEVRFQNLSIDADIAVGARGEPTVLNSYRNTLESGLQKLRIMKPNKHRFRILDDISGALRPGRITLLLGPPGAGKSTLLNALAGRLQKSILMLSGDITYNGKKFNEFQAVHTAAYVDQNDLHQAELTVRETLDFAARCQGIGHKAEELQELQKKEKEMNVQPDWEIDAFTKAQIRTGKRHSIVTDLILKLLGLDVCADTLIGDDQIRGVSGGQRKRVTTGELLVGPKKTLFLDEISTGLDSSTTFQITRTLREFSHLRAATMLVALLQPTPETYNLFDDIMLLSEGKLVYHGPREEILPFFESQHMHCPERKADSDFLQEVTSRKDQKQYFKGKGKYQYIPVATFADNFQKTDIAKQQMQYLEEPYKAPNKKCEEALITHHYALSFLQRIKALMWREFTLMKRTIVVYKAKTLQVVVTSLVAATLFLRTHIHPISPNDGQEIAGYCFFATLVMLFNGIAELSMSTERLPVFWKQRRMLFFDAASFAFPTFLQRIPFSLTEAVVWSVLSYFPVGLAGQPGRFFMFLALLFLTHQIGICIYRVVATASRQIVVANAAGMLLLLCVFLMNGFVIRRPFIHPWVIWIYWANPLSYITRAILINEFTAHHWQNKLYPYGSTQTLGDGIMGTIGISTHYYWCWIAIGVCLAYILLFNVIIVILLTVLPPLGANATHQMTQEALAERQAALHGDAGTNESFQVDIPPKQPTDKARGAGGAVAESGALVGNQNPTADAEAANGPDPSFRRGLSQGTPSRTANGTSSAPANGNAEDMENGEVGKEAESQSDGDGKGKASSGMVLPFDPMTMTFKDLHYYVPIPKEAAEGKEHVHQEGGQAMLELLVGISGAFRPGVLTCLMGVSGAGKTTLMDVLAGRKTAGKIEGDIRINGHPKEQSSFARVSGYVEQFDTHTAAATVKEALLFSGTLRNGKDVDTKTTQDFVQQVLGLVELESQAGAVVGRPGQSGLSVEQRKRLTIAVELVANPSIVFMDEPTSGLDARAAAIVMRAVRNIVNTGRTIVCTIHQPSIDIFESFDELLLLKRGGETIFNGQLGEDSKDLVKYFQGVEGVPNIEQGLNPATWMLEVTTPGMEDKLGVSFAEYYSQSELAKHYAGLLEEYSSPKEGSKKLQFKDKFPKPLPVQFTAIFTKYMAVYWRMPEYNGTRFFLALAVGFIFGAIFWRLGDKVTTQAGLTNVLGALYATTLFFSIINATVIQPVIAAERAVSYRERAAGMYSVFPFTVALGCVEIIYISVQVVMYTMIVYWMCWFQRDAGKFFWFLLFNYLTLIYFTFFGMMAVALTPNIKLAAVCSAYFYSLFNLFAGFTITQPNMPGWWIWFSYINPIFWTVYGLIMSQVDNLETLCALQTGQEQPVYEAVLTLFGYHRGMLGWIVLILVAWIFINWTATYLALSKLNFLKR
ncbi:TPA: hypothetical protein ACH3X2_007820 [Trebouxia sp. C0005]